MAKVFGPLHSDDASGRIKRAIVFLKWKGQNRVRIWARPYNPKTRTQRLLRECFCRAVQGWHSLSEEYVAGWNAYADTISTDLNPVSGFNVFVGAYIQNNCDYPGTVYQWRQTKECLYTSRFATLTEIAKYTDHWWQFDDLSAGQYRDFGKIRQDLTNIDTTLGPGIIYSGVKVQPGETKTVCETDSTLQIHPSFFSMQFFLHSHNTDYNNVAQIKIEDMLYITICPPIIRLKVYRVGGHTEIECNIGDFDSQWTLLSIKVTDTYTAIYRDKEMICEEATNKPVLTPTHKLEIIGSQILRYYMDELIILKEHDPILDLADFMTYEY